MEENNELNTQDNVYSELVSTVKIPDILDEADNREYEQTEIDINGGK